MTAPDWEAAVGGRADAVLCINMVHIAPWAATVGLMRGAARLLPAGGVLCLYGPFRREGRHTAPSNAAFDAQLRATDPAWGVRDLEAVAAEAAARGFAAPAVEEMPANNLFVVFRRGRYSAMTVSNSASVARTSDASGKLRSLAMRRSSLGVRKIR